MEQQPRLPLWFLVENSSLIAIAFLAGALLGGRGFVRFPRPQADALQVVYQKILEAHVEPHDGAALLDTAITAMAGDLDDYSRYVPPADVQRYEESSTGRYEGIGLVWREHDGEIVVHFPFAGGPADREGIRPGDRLVAVDGKRMADVAPERRGATATELVRGPAGTPVRLAFERDGSEVEATVNRESVQRPAVKWANLVDPEAGIGYLHITDFHIGIAAGVRDAIAELRRQGELRGLVIDLRFDGGGSLDECVALSRMFQPSGVIVSTRRRGEELERVEARPEECLFPELPLALLVNGDSASASEVFAGCLQDHGRALVVGTRTYGKGVVNTVYSWPEFKLKLTTAYYFTPNGRSLGGSHRLENGDGSHPEIGIAPDVDAPIGDQERTAVLLALREYEVPPAHRDGFAKVAARYGLTVPNPPQPGDDSQLAQALDELKKRLANGHK
ncbi:MAG: S41 family peptidase [Planctomycetes bacterium]|nr:S41 family peptidase [Planctomycetota bacterium]